MGHVCISKTGRKQVIVKQSCCSNHSSRHLYYMSRLPITPNPRALGTAPTRQTHLTTQLLLNSFFNFYSATRSSICNLSTSVPKLLRLLACAGGLLYISSNYKNKCEANATGQKWVTGHFWLRQILLLLFPMNVENLKKKKTDALINIF